MSASFVQNIVTSGNSQSGSQYSAVIDTGVTTTPGNVVIFWVQTPSGRYVTSVSDTRSNSTWQVDNAGAKSSSNIGIISAVMDASNYLRAGDTITFSLSGSGTATGKSVGAAEFSGLDISSGYANALVSSNIHINSNTTGALTSSSGGNSGDLVITALGSSSATTPTLTATDSSQWRHLVTTRQPGANHQCRRWLPDCHRDKCLSCIVVLWHN